MADFAIAVNYVLHNEDESMTGVVTNDSGGRTRWGISERAYPQLGDSDFFVASRDESLATAMAIYHADYWPRIHGDDIDNEAVAAKCLDLVVDMGVDGGTKVVQNACSQCGLVTAADGAFGPSTLRNVNTVHPVDLMIALVNQASVRYRHIALQNPEEAVDLKGWLKRAYKVPQSSFNSQEKV